MKTFLHAGWIGVVTTLVTASAFAFEGRVSLGITAEKGGEQVIDFATKGDLVRMEPQSGEARGATMIMNAAKQEITILMPSERMYMVMPMRGGPAQQTDGSDAKDVKIEKTGRTEKILGYTCEEWIMTDNGETTAMWVTEQLGNFMGLGGGNPMGGMMGGRKAKANGSAWEKLLKEKKAWFPLRVVSRDGRGKEKFRLEAKKIEPGSLPDDLFAPPAGFQKFAMPAMGGFGG
jgi:hypothetical protein